MATNTTVSDTPTVFAIVRSSLINLDLQNDMNTSSVDNSLRRIKTAAVGLNGRKMEDQRWLAWPTRCAMERTSAPAQVGLNISLGSGV